MTKRIQWTSEDRQALIGRRVIVKGYVRTIVATTDVPGRVVLDRSVDQHKSWDLDAVQLVSHD